MRGKHHPIPIPRTTISWTVRDTAATAVREYAHDPHRFLDRPRPLARSCRVLEDRLDDLAAKPGILGRSSYPPGGARAGAGDTHDVEPVRSLTEMIRRERGPDLPAGQVAASRRAGLRKERRRFPGRAVTHHQQTELGRRPRQVIVDEAQALVDRHRRCPARAAAVTRSPVGHRTERLPCPNGGRIAGVLGRIPYTSQQGIKFDRSGNSLGRTGNWDRLSGSEVIVPSCQNAQVPISQG